MKKIHVFTLMALLFSGVMFGCSEEEDPCAQYAAEYSELKTALDLHFEAWEALSEQEQEETPLMTWVFEDPEGRIYALAEFISENGETCNKFFYPEYMEPLL
tara:strand:+ start:22303 stop:22608 length:306 start_codon:yes stop_codon:yes gene_type:complete